MKYTVCIHLSERKNVEAIYVEGKTVENLRGRWQISGIDFTILFQCDWLYGHSKKMFLKWRKSMPLLIASNECRRSSTTKQSHNKLDTKKNRYTEWAIRKWRDQRWCTIRWIIASDSETVKIILSQ
jgi:hypothetical protein